MKTVKYGLLICSLLFFPSRILAGREWPDDSASILTAFGAAKEGRFSRGLGFRSEGQRVSAWSDGEIIWVVNSTSVPETIPGTGLVVIEHENGFRTSYRGIEHRPDLNKQVTRGEWIGYAGYGEWVFEIADTERARIVNPISLLPGRTDPPATPVGRVELTRGNNTLNLIDGIEVASGSWTIVIYDLSTLSGAAIPIEISLFWVGERIGDIRFDALSEIDGQVVLEGTEQKLFDDIFSDGGHIWFRNVQLNTGRGTLELRIRDETDRVVSKSWSLTVR